MADPNSKDWRNNFVKSPTTTGTDLDFLNATPVNNKPRASTRPNRNAKIQNVDDNSSKGEEDEYNNLLPAVKTRKRKKASPTSVSGKGESVMDRRNGNNPTS